MLDFAVSRIHAPGVSFAELTHEAQHRRQVIVPPDALADRFRQLELATARLPGRPWLVVRRALDSRRTARTVLHHLAEDRVEAGRARLP